MPALWLDDPYVPRSPLDGDASADVCVVGAGIGGLATAWRLVRSGADVLVVEAAEVASGASGRNGGFFIAGAAPAYHETVRLWGRERAAAIHRATLAAQREMLATAREVGAEGHFRMTGMLRLAIDDAEARDVEAHAAALAADGFHAELLDPPPTPFGRLGLLTPTDGAVHPVRWLRALAAAIEKRGGRIAERTRVVAPPVTGRVVTEHGTVRCEHTVVAVDGTLAGLVPAARAVRARRLNMLATAPVAPLLASPVYARYGHEYVQQTADGRIALGGFSDLDGEASWTDRPEPSAAVQARLDAYLERELGVRAEVTHRWAGVVGYAEEPLPRCGPVPGTDGRVLALGGYNGTGHVQAWVASGHVVAAISGRTAEPLYAPVDA